MDKRIRLVWALSIITMLLILCGQAYWLYNQYVFSRSQNIAKIESACTDALKKEQKIRIAEKQRLVSQKKVKVPGVTVCYKFEKEQDKETKATVSYIIDKGKRKTINVSNLNSSATFDLADRYVASYVKRLQKHVIDSLLTLSGYDTTENFQFYHSEWKYITPFYSVKNNFAKYINVKYSSNPLKGEVVTFSIRPSAAQIIKNMIWQLVGSLFLIAILAFCLWYQMKTIMIQKRIDGIRHEFMKNMIYEMKQLPAEEPTEKDVMHIGNTDFIYSTNELHFINERVIITSRQAEILHILARNVNESVSREDILNEVWGDDSYANSMALNVQITYLRRALRSDNSLSIDAVIKKGYELREVKKEDE